MPLYAGELNIRRGAPLQEYPASLGQVLSAQAEDTRVNNPTNALIRLYEMDAANRGELINPGDPLQGELPTYEPVTKIDAVSARARVKEEGLPITIPDDGISQRALDIIIKAKRDELRRQSIMSRGPDGIGAGAARLGTALINSLYDPLNIASAFIPVVGPAKYAAMVSRATSAIGRAGVRFGVGAAEGVVGAAILEPLVYSAAQAEQLDYTMTDSLANIAFGGLFGGGLHSLGGAVRDVAQPGWWRAGHPLPTDVPRIKPDALNEPPILRGMDRIDAVPRSPIRSPDAMDALDMARRVAEAEKKPGFQRSAEDIMALKQELTPEAARAVEILKQEAFERAPEDRIFLAALEKGREADYINDRVGDMLRQMDDIDRSFVSRGNSPDSASAILAKQPLAQQLDAAVKRLAELGRPVNEAALVLERVSPQTREAALKAAVVQSVEGRVVDVDALVRTDAAARRPAEGTSGKAMAEATAAAVKNNQPAAIRSADPEASAAVERINKASGDAGRADLRAAEDELEQAVTAADELAAALGERDAVKKGLADYDKAIARAEQYAKALRAGAACGVA